MITVTKKFTFEYAHCLPNYQGDCARVHGHRGVCLISVKGEIDSESGMIIDFKQLKKDMNPIFDQFDHHMLNNFIPNPTAENMLKYIVASIRGLNEWYEANLYKVRVYETEDSYAEWVCSR